MNKRSSKIVYIFRFCLKAEDTVTNSRQICKTLVQLQMVALFCLFLSLVTTVKSNIINNSNTTFAVDSVKYRRRLTYNANKEFNYKSPGRSQTFVVPYGVTSIYVEATGAASGLAMDSSPVGTQGSGAKVTSILSVIPGTTLYIYIGGRGMNGYSSTGTSYSGGWNGGGNGYAGAGGGGATDIRNGTGTSNRLLVAAGGGGPYIGCFPSNGGNGVGLYGIAGTTACGGIFGGGSGATQSAGGTNSNVHCGTGCTGTLGQGGNGNSLEGGGGGGGGYYGGAGGYKGGGGGGSSYSVGTGTTFSTFLTVNGYGYLTMFYDPPPTSQPTRQPSKQPSQQPTMQPSSQPSYQSSSQPSRQPSGLPSLQPTSQPCCQPSGRPSAQPSRQSTAQPTSQPSRQPSGQPSSQPSSQPSGEPSMQPSSQPSCQPSGLPTCQPVMKPSKQPSQSPTSDPSLQPISQPSMSPTSQPSLQPISEPSKCPTVQPSCQPTSQPSMRPMSQPTGVPTKQSVAAPSRQPSSCPTSLPLVQPSSGPSEQPSCTPSAQPSLQPSEVPTDQPSCIPSVSPSVHPSSQPSGQPSSVPSKSPSANPSILPSGRPSVVPTKSPSANPSIQPSGRPYVVPSLQPVSTPSYQPGSRPTIRPVAVPSLQPSNKPSTQPSRQPSCFPSSRPSMQPTRLPFVKPSCVSFVQPSSGPSTQPTGQPSALPTVRPRATPSYQPRARPAVDPSVVPSLLSTSITTNQAPEIINFAAVSGRTSITVNVLLSSSGIVYCAAYRYFADQSSLNVIPGSLTEIMMQNSVASTGTGNVSSVLIGGLNAVTNYSVYCVALSPSNVMSPLAVVLANVRVVQTACCKSLDIKTTSNTVIEGQVSLNFISVLFSSIPSSQIVLTLSIYNARTNAIVTVSPLVPSVFVVDSSTSSRSITLTSSLSAMSTGTYFINATLSGTFSNEFEVTYNGLSVRQLAFNTQSSAVALPAPVLKSAIFACDGTHVVILFDSRTDNGGTSTEFTCSHLFNFTCASVSKCRWTDDGATMLAYIDTSVNCAKVDDTITLLASAVIKARCISTVSSCNTTSWAHTVAPSVLTIQSSTDAISPTISMSAPTTLGQCAPLILDMSGSKGSGGRAWKSYRFIVTSSSQSANVSVIQQFLNTEYKMSPPTPIPWQLLSSGVSYTFTATLCNFMNKCSQKTVKTLMLSSVLPTVILPGASTRYVTRNSALTVNSNAYVTDCTGSTVRSGLTYEWRLYSANVLLPLESTSKEPSKLLLPAYTLTVGTLYTVSLIVTIVSTSKASVASIQILVKQGNVVARIAGGTTQTVGMNSAVTFDASSSYDEDVNGGSANLIYSWSCKQIAPTLCSSCSDIFQDSALIVANRTTFVAHTKSASIANYVAQITVTVSDKLSDRVSTASTTLTILPDSVPVVNVVTLGVRNGVVNSGQVVQLQGTTTLSSGTTGVAEWSTSDNSLVDLSSISLSPLSMSIPSSSSAFNIFLALAGNSLPAGTMLTFSLTCKTLGNSSSTASVSFTVNAPPAPGTFQVTALPIVTGQLPQFTFFAANWEDADTSLTYQFGYISNAGTRIVLVAKSEATYSTTSVPTGLASVDYMVQCFADIADSYGANTTAVYYVRIESVSTGSLSLVSSLLSKPSSTVNEITQVTAIANGLLNTVTCSAAPNCESLNRLSCAKTRNTCGSCINKQYVGDEGDTNTKCVRASSVKNRRLSSTVLTCSDTSECTGFEECTGGLCIVPMKNCTSGCMNGGTCIYVNSDRRTPVSDCRVGDTSCIAVCECFLEYAGSHDCSMNSTELIARKSSRLLVLKNIASLMALEDPDQQSVVAWINSLSEATQSPDELNDEALSLVLSLSTSLMNYASEVGLSSNYVKLLLNSIDAATQASANVHQRRRRLAENSNTGNYSSTLIHTQNALNLFSALVSNNMLPGQYPVQVLFSQFRSNIQVISANGDASNISMSIPLSDLEVLNGVKASSVSVPRSNDSAAAVRMSVTSMLSSLYNTLDESLESNPVTVQMSALPSCATSPCRIVIELQFSLAMNHSRLYPNRPEMVHQTCRKGLNITYNHTCSDGHVLHLQCNGTAARVLNSQCPYTSYSPVCNTLMGSNVTVGGCTEISHTNTSITCSCLPEFYRRRLQSDNSSDGYSVSYVSMLSAVESSFLTTVSSADNLNASTLKTGWRTIVTIGTFAAAIVIALLWSNHADETKKAKEKEQKGAKKTVVSALKRIKQGGGKLTTTASTPRKPKAVRKSIVRNADLALIESALPNVLSSQSLTQRILEEVRLNHRWIGVVFFYSERFPRVLRVISLATNIIIMLFIQSLTYTLTNPEDGSCELLTTKATCIEPRSPFATGESMCSWSDGGECSFIQPSNSSRTILFVAIFSAIISTPIALASDWVVRHILSSSTKEYKDKIVPTGNAATPLDVTQSVTRDRKVGLTINSQSNMLLAQGEVNELHIALVSYRDGLSDTQRKEFDLVWGLDSEGQFLSPDDNNGATNALWTRLHLFKQSVTKTPDVRQLLTDEISRVLDSVKLESDSMLWSSASQREIGRKLLFLFQCDLLPGVSGQILYSKGQRDALSTKQVSLAVKICGWVFTFLLNAGMLFYILLFALSESEQRQGAWFKSFIMWLVVEILLVSTGVVVFTHIFIPLLTMRDVTKIKQRMLDSIQSFHESVAKKRLCAKGDQYHIVGGVEVVSPFNAADYLFVSSRVAKKYPELKEAQIIAQFSTPWPKQSYQHVTDVSKNYSKRWAAVTRSFSIIAVFMLTSLLRIPPTLQDMVVQMTTTVTIGYTVLLHIDLFEIFPLLAFGPVIAACIIVHFFIQSQKSAAKQRLAKLFPTPVAGDVHLAEKYTAHKSRRASAMHAISVAEQIRKVHKNSGSDKLNEVECSCVVERSVEDSSPSKDNFSIDLSEESRLAKLFPTPVDTNDKHTDEKHTTHKSRRASAMHAISVAEQIRNVHNNSSSDKLNEVREPIGSNSIAVSSVENISLSSDYIFDDEDSFSINLSEETRLSVVGEGDFEDGDESLSFTMDSAMLEEYCIQDSGEEEVDSYDEDVDEDRYALHTSDMVMAESKE